MIAKDRYLVIFSILTSLLSAGLGFVEKFIQSIHEVDLLVIFFSGIFILLVILILLFFLVKEVITRIPVKWLKIKPKKTLRRKSKKGKKRK